MEEQEWDCSGKASVQLATGETRNLRKSVASAEKNICLLLFTAWNGQEQGGLGGFLLGKYLCVVLPRLMGAVEV